MWNQHRLRSCRQATCHYLSQCWPRCMSPYGVTKSQWAKLAFRTRSRVYNGLLFINIWLSYPVRNPASFFVTDILASQISLWFNFSIHITPWGLLNPSAIHKHPTQIAVGPGTVDMLMNYYWSGQNEHTYIRYAAFILTNKPGLSRRLLALIFLQNTFVFCNCIGLWNTHFQNYPTFSQIKNIASVNVISYLVIQIIVTYYRNKSPKPLYTDFTWLCYTCPNLGLRRYLSNPKIWINFIDAKSHETRNMRICEPVYQKQVSRAGTNNYIPHYLWDVITCSCL